MPSQIYWSLGWIACLVELTIKYTLHTQGDEANYLGGFVRSHTYTELISIYDVFVLIVWLFEQALNAFDFSQQEVDLSSWTAYSSYLHVDSFMKEAGQDICVLMEARRPPDLDKFVDNSLRIPPTQRVHVSMH